MKPTNSAGRLVLALLITALATSNSASALPAIVSRATDSIAALLASGKQQQPSLASGQVQGQPSGLPVELRAVQPIVANATGAQQSPPSIAAGAQSIQAHLNSLQNQAQRQLNQLNGLVMNGANQLMNASQGVSNSNGTNKIGNVLEVLSNVGKAIQQQIMGNNQNVQIMTSNSNSPTNVEPANVKKNEYQSIVVGENQPFNSNGYSLGGNQQVAQLNINSTNYREQGEVLRQEIVRRAGQLQQVVASSMDVLKNNGDLIVRRLLEQLNQRLDQAKSKADRIINEPATNEMGVRALNTINHGLNNLNNIITNIVNRLDINSKEAIRQQMNGAQRSSSATNSTNSGPAPLLNAERIRQNLQQLGQQFSSAINAAQQQRQLQQLNNNGQPVALGQQVRVN